jgi:hypothetical protein
MTWERITAPLDRRRVVYWNLDLSELLRVAVKRAGGRYVWKVYERDDRRYGWRLDGETGSARTLRAAQRAGAAAARARLSG